MKIKQITSQFRSDFSATMECEHCRHTEHITNGYHDDFFHERVIPAMRCAACGKNRAGEMAHTDKDVSPMVV